MVASDGETTATSDREIVVTRVFDAPRELVFEAWTDPEQVVDHDPRDGRAAGRRLAVRNARP